MVGYAKALRKGLNFGIEPKRWLQFLIVDIVFMLIAIGIGFTTIPQLLALMQSTPQSIESAMTLASLAGYFVVLFVVWILIRLWLAGSMIRQSVKEKETISKSLKFGANKYLSILLATIIVAVISIIVSVVPYVGWIFSIIVALVFFFFMQGIVVDNLGFATTLESSWKVFKKKPLQVFISWLLITIVTLAIYFIFSIPAGIILLWIVMPITPGMGATLPQNELFRLLMQTLQTNAVGVIIVIVILLIGFAVATTFALKAQTEFYQEFKKKFKWF